MTKKQKLNLIEEPTTHKSDFQVWPLHPVTQKTEFRTREKPVPKPHPPYVGIDPQSHAPYNPRVHVPFDLFIRPKPIVGKDPREPFRTAVLPETRVGHADDGITTRPPPCLSIGEIEDEERLRILLKYTYTGMHKVLMEEAALKVPEKGAEFINRVVDSGRDLKYKPVLYPPLPPGWITAARHWDCLQSRFLGDPFKTFWTRRGPEIECGCCCNPVPEMLPKETVEEIDKLICEDGLSLPYDVTKTGYQGYRPMVAKGVPLGKKPNQ